ncbi:antibiotic biosynthesis monooxygenase [Mycolicibacterium monacense]|uniref:ABM domain-containing protein n=4 Tax=Mycobacteriaceae TaxID=1762 RepID=A0AAD1MYW1_MYCMB|nr:antibiotic biosynthesis monooxygenase [Mycolicibacterium monacense]MDA4105123.1 hypothetical protein [Mycolicibacterium monacense DSM 44395]OBB76406.1 hypothetical protein A6B34_12250 [Mycolicibacterium monacense]OBF48522.1 hypothetical protein A5778_23165 [Mycolicibacterium monacense]ORB19551.1 hypothetical protein BST34_14785 [Mycolicibacterium monacense DSM 44395]QHP86026.1 hypothetical protein EWR22_11940 [Mycolicibacterium monacense DSM 44395]
MFARTTTIEARPDAVDAGVAHIRNEVMPVLRDVDGCVGLSLLVDRESSRCIATTAWESVEAMHAAEERVRPVRERAAEVFGGTPVVDEWEIAVLHREHRAGAGAGVRATWLRARPEQFDQAVAFYRSEVLPSIEELDGFCSASLMIDRTSGRAVSSVSFDSMGAMDRTRDQARSLRTARLRDLGADQLDVGEFELVIANLRVPEMA